MRLKTTIKLFFQNLTMVWKLTLFKFIIFLVIMGLLSVSAMPIISKLNNSGFSELVYGLFDFSNFDFATLGERLSNIAKEFFYIIKTNWSNLKWSIILFFVIATFLSPYLNALLDIPTTDVLYGSMSCNAKFGFGGRFISNLFTSIKYAFVKTIAAIFVNVIICSIFFGLMFIATKLKVFAIIMPLFAIFVLLILLSFKLTLFCCYAPTVVAKGYGVVNGLFKSLYFSFKNFWANYATAFALILLIVALNGFIILFTLFAGAFITVPTTYVLIAIFNMVIFYSSSGMFFYIGENNIIDNSKGVKRPEQQDTIKKLKNII